MQRRALRRQRWSTTTATEQKSKTNPAAKIRNKEQTEYQKRQKKLIALNHIAKSGVNERLQSGTTSRKQVFAPEAPVTMPASAVVQESADKPSWFQSGASPKEVADSYIKYADGKGIPRTIIIGSGRGKINERSTGNYAEKVYGNRSSRFLLVNYENGSGQGQRMKPDI
ncbi:hypothetical protein FACS189472_01240 [Alphaproteobacteria bacterium]|nr:hypothetical protein FACS189472_01240 [Alphaproteobacteria bacterium]